jgi:hypothetical protein
MAKITTRWVSVFQFGNGYEFIRVLEMQGGLQKEDVTRDISKGELLDLQLMWKRFVYGRPMNTWLDRVIPSSSLLHNIRVKIDIQQEN